jgi:hypothetical protein
MIIIRLLVWELPSVGGLDRIIFAPLSIIVHVLEVLLHVRVKVISMSDHPFLPSRLNKRGTDKWTNHSDLTTLQSDFLKKVIS